LRKRGRAITPPHPRRSLLSFKHLRRPVIPDLRFKFDDLNILDPCAGEAKALVQIAEGLAVSPGRIYAVELNVTKASTIAAILDGYVPSDPPHVVRGFTSKAVDQPANSRRTARSQAAGREAHPLAGGRLAVG
jgi:hypothetical protein